MFAILWVCHAPWAYLLWIGTTLSLVQRFLRLRQIGAHAVVPDALSQNPLLHACSTDAAWWEKMLITPHYEHYHLEHHLLPTAPSWNLVQLRKILVEAEVLPAGSHSRGGYAEVLKQATLPR